MNRKNILWAILEFVFVIVFNIVFFVLAGTKHPASVWISYAFIHIAYVLILITPFLNRKGRDSALFGWALQAISGAYFGIAFLVGIIFILIHPDSFKLPLVVQIVLIGIYLIMLIPNMLANDMSSQRTEEQIEALQYVKSCSGRLKVLLDWAQDKPLKMKIQSAYDIIHASPVKSSGIARNYELLIVDLIDLLEEYIKQESLVDAAKTLDEIIQKANERNTRLLQTEGQ